MTTTMTRQSASSTTKSAESGWLAVGQASDLVAFSGIGAAIPQQEGSLSVAIFWLPGEATELYALSNYCPFSGVHILARGIVGDLGGEPVVASPLHKEHFSLRTGICIEDPAMQVAVWPVRLRGDILEVGMQPVHTTSAENNPGKAA